jgi:hypothetical protein
MSGRTGMTKVSIAVAVVAAALMVAAPVMAGTTIRYQATYVEPVGGPNQPPFSCSPGTSCGSASISGIGQSDDQVVTFNACGIGCHIRVVTFADGSELVIQIVDQPGPFAFTSPGNSGSHGYNGVGLPGNPNFLDFTEAILGGTGRFAGATGSGTGTVKVAGGVATGKSSRTVTLP